MLAAGLWEGTAPQLLVQPELPGGATQPQASKPHYVTWKARLWYMGSAMGSTLGGLRTVVYVAIAKKARIAHWPMLAYCGGILWCCVMRGLQAL